MFNYKEDKEFRSLLLDVQCYTCPQGTVPDDFYPIVRITTHNLASYFKTVAREKILLKEVFETLYYLLNFSTLSAEKKVQVNNDIKKYPPLFILHQIREREPSFYQDKKIDTDFSVLADKSGEYLSEYIEFAGTILGSHLSEVVHRLREMKDDIERENELSQDPFYSHLFKESIEKENKIEVKGQKNSEKQQEAKVAPPQHKI